MESDGHINPPEEPLCVQTLKVQTIAFVLTADMKTPTHPIIRLQLVEIGRGNLKPLDFGRYSDQPIILHR